MPTEIDEEHAELVRQIAGRIYKYLPSHLDAKDIYSEGMIGLLHALEASDPEQNFVAYAKIRILGAIKDYLRRLDWAPRSVRIAIQKYDKARRAVENRYKRAALVEEIADELGVTAAKAYRMQARVEPLTLVPFDSSLFADADGGGRPLSEIIASPGAPVEPEIVELLRRAIHHLSPQQREVVELYYYEGWTMKQVGEYLGITESRISQIHTKAVNRMRLWLHKRGMR